VQLNDSDTYDLNSKVDIPSNNSMLKIIIDQSAFERLSFDTTYPVYEDIIIEVDLEGVIIDEVHAPGNISLYTTSEGIFQIPFHLIIQVWT